MLLIGHSNETRSRFFTDHGVFFQLFRQGLKHELPQGTDYIWSLFPIYETVGMSSGGLERNESTLPARNSTKKPMYTMNPTLIHGGRRSDRKEEGLPWVRIQENMAQR